MRYSLGFIFLISGLVIHASVCPLRDRRVNHHLYQSDIVHDSQSGMVFFEGDILLDSQDVNQIETRGQFHPPEKWSDGIIPYVISEYFCNYFKVIIGRAMLEIQRKTCIRFVPRKNESDYIYINNNRKNSCFSFVGRKGGKQTLNLDDNCIVHGTILHELMHAIGFYHEHSRHDRDKHVTINYDEISPDMLANYEKVPGLSNDACLQYDYYSITHYSRRQGVTPKIGHVAIGQRKRLSVLDVEGIKMVYHCSSIEPKESECDDLDPFFCPMIVSRFGKCMADMKKGCKRTCNTHEFAKKQDRTATSP